MNPRSVVAAAAISLVALGILAAPAFGEGGGGKGGPVVTQSVATTTTTTGTGGNGGGGNGGGNGSGGNGASSGSSGGSGAVGCLGAASGSACPSQSSRPVVDPVVVAREVVGRLQLPGSKPVFGPDPSLNTIVPGTLAVGFPYWMSVPGGAVQRSSASAQGLTIALEARRTRVDFDFGDGSARLSCAKTTPWRFEIGYDGNGQPVESPTCGHRFTRPGSYTVRATVSWSVAWSGAGQSGVIEVTGTDAVSYRCLNIVTRVER